MVDLVRRGEESLVNAVVFGGVDDGGFAGAAGGADQGIEDRLSSTSVLWCHQGEDFDPITKFQRCQLHFYQAKRQFVPGKTW